MSISGIQGQATHQLHWQNAVAQSQSVPHTPSGNKAASAKDGDGDHGVEPGKGQHVNKMA